MPPWQLGLGLAAAVAYALGSHWLMLHAADRPWAVAVILGPLLLGVAAVGWRRRHGPTLLGVLVTLGVLAVIVARGGVADVNRLYVLQHAGIHFALGWGFATSMRGVSTITAIALRVHHGRLTPEMHAYTRRVTVAWALYFFAMTALSIALYLGAPWAVWSLFANVATPVAAAALFVGEHTLRYVLHPEFERATMADAVRAFSTSTPSGSAR